MASAPLLDWHHDSVARATDPLFQAVRAGGVVHHLMAMARCPFQFAWRALPACKDITGAYGLRR